jgi:hypothetical protein
MDDNARFMMAFDQATRETGWMLFLDGEPYVDRHGDPQYGTVKAGNMVGMAKRISWAVYDLPQIMHKMTDRPVSVHIGYVFEAVHARRFRGGKFNLQTVINLAGLLGACEWIVKEGAPGRLDFVGVPIWLDPVTTWERNAAAGISNKLRSEAQKEHLTTFARTVTGFDGLNEHESMAYWIGLVGWGKWKRLLIKEEAGEQ